MITVYKYELEEVGASSIAEVLLPALAEIVDVQFQGTALCVWAKVDTDQKPCVRRFLCAMTGSLLERELQEGEELQHVGTAHATVPGFYVVHVFEIREKRQWKTSL